MISTQTILNARHLLQTLKSTCKFRRIFSVTGSWDPELTHDINKNIERHWRDKINASNSQDDAEKFYLLSMFPYPSGNLHMGHVRVYTISDALARFYRMQGKKVIHPIGWDAFGLPAENAAIHKNIHPAAWTSKNIEFMKKQLQMLNISFDWNMELSTCDPSFYKWTQYIFLLLYEKGLAYKNMAQVNWDPVDETVLADEQVDENGISWRSGCKVEKKTLTQWFIRTTAFAKNLYDGLDDPQLLNWRDVKKIQQNWIGDRFGYTLHLKLFGHGVELENTFPVWTETPELIYGASFVSVSPEHVLNTAEFGGSFKSGTHQLDVEVIHPLTGSLLPVFVSDQFSYPQATCSFLGIPSASSDEISFSFALNHELDVIPVSDSKSNSLINSEEFSGMKLSEARAKIIEKIERSGVKVFETSNKLKDWLISRQRYWGTPIPIINCPTCKAVPVPFEDLPVVLPNIDFKGKGSSLKSAKDWIEVKCPKCGGMAERETDTMDTFVDSSWYFMRYLDVTNNSLPFDSERINDRMPVNLYVGGKEHASLHLFYARFMTHFCHSVGLLRHSEPFLQLLMQGMIQGQSFRVKSSGKYIPKDEVDFTVSPPVEKISLSSLIVEWEKMSKSKFNGIDPEEVILQHGIDTTRLFILGSVAPQSPRKWNDDLWPGIWNWQRRIWITVSDFLVQKKNDALLDVLSNEEIENYKEKLKHARNFHIKKVTHNFMITNQLSVAIAKLQSLTTNLRNVPKIVVRNNVEYEEALASLLIMLAPLAPHFASELWAAFCSVQTYSTKYDVTKSVLQQKWPVRDTGYEIDVRVNNREFHTLPVPTILDKKQAVKLAMDDEVVQKELKDMDIQNITYKLWATNDAELDFLSSASELKKKKAMKKQKKTSAVQAN